MKARIKWVENACFVGETGSGHAIVIDGPESIGGRNLGVRPMELMLMSVGACSAVDVIHILKKANGIQKAEVQSQVRHLDPGPLPISSTWPC